MKGNAKIIFIGIGLLLLAALYVIIENNQSRFNWYESYDIESKEPYGAYVLGQMLKDYYPGKKVIILKKSLKESLTGTKKDKRNYFFIGYSFPDDSSEIENLKTFVALGNSAFISCSGSNLLLKS